MFLPHEVGVPGCADVLIVVVAWLIRELADLGRGRGVIELFLMLLGIDTQLQAPDEVRHIGADVPATVDSDSTGMEDGEDVSPGP